MSQLHGSETQFELTTIERLRLLGYTHLLGSEIESGAREVVLVPVLRTWLAARYPELPDAILDSAVERLRRPEGADTLRRNQAFHCDLLTRGFEITYEAHGARFKGATATYGDKRVEHEATGSRRTGHIYPIDWAHPERNEFHVVNQLPVSGKNDRRPDIVIYVNGLPLVVFELKNPYAEDPTVEDALNQIGHYTVDIPQLFEFNAFCVVSDGANTLHGVWSAGREWYAPWKSIDGHTVEPGKTGSMKTLVEGLFRKERLLAYIRDFIVFEVDRRGVAKKGAKYHQFFAVLRAVEKTLSAFDAGADGRIGVVWHTTGAGKSLSMAFLVGILRREPKLRNPTFVVQVDRTDLDNQLHDQFVLARHLVGDVRQAQSIDDLRELLRGEGGEVIFTTIEKFSLKREENGREITHPVLSKRDNVIVIADEAHRSQYGFLKGFARYLNEALPNAKRLGFTGTPVSFTAADTVEVFGDYVHTYDIRQSQEDGATVPIFYTPRQARLHLSRTDIDAALADLTEGYTAEELGDFDRRKTRWAALAAAAGAKDRVEAIAKDLVAHFSERTKTLAGKALVVCMTRENCVRMYSALTKLPSCPEVKIVMTGNLGIDPKAWSEAGHITTKAQRDAIKTRMVDPDDPLRIVIVCDMWLTGTDIPCLHTLYVDKPMRGHNVIQAISRVNRVFRDKPHGLIVDYIGIGDELREATDKYTRGGGKGEPAPDVEKEAWPLFLSAVESVRAALPPGKDCTGWRKLSAIAFEDLHMEVYGWLTEEDSRRDGFLEAELRLMYSYLLVKHLPQAAAFADEVIFCQRARRQVVKTLPGKQPPQGLERAVRDLVDDHVEAEGVVDIFKLAGIATPDVSIIDEKFLQTFKDRPHLNLRVKLLEKLMRDEIVLRAARNLAKAKSFRELLEATLDRYHKRIIDAAAVVRAMVEMKKEFDADERRAKALGLSDEELAFYDAVEVHCKNVYGEPFLRDLVHDVVATIKGNLKVDWTEPHRENVKAAVRAAVRRVLRKREVKTEDFEPLLAEVMKQAEALYAEWPLAA